MLNTFFYPFIVLIFSVGVLGCHSENQAQDTQTRRPNILFAIADDHSFPHAGAYGTKWVKTPAFDMVAANGIRFDNCYTPNAKCAPSRAVLLTGRNSWQLEEAANHIGFWPESKFPTFCEMLGEGGYTVGFTGKGWAPGDPGEKNGRKRLLTGIPYQAHKLQPPTVKISTNDYAANFAEFVDEAPKGKPWMFWYGGLEPHREYEYGTGVRKGKASPSDIKEVPAFWPDNDTVRNDMLDYAYEINHFDSHLMKMIKKLEEMGQLENTVIIVTADNGMPFPRAKGLQYEYSNHLPLAIMWKKGIASPGRSEQSLISFIDVAPTIMALAGASEEQMRQMDMVGKDMLDLFEKKQRHDRSYLLLGQERHDYGRPQNQGYPIRSIIEGGYLYVYNFKPELWPVGNPETGYLNTDGSPTKTQILQMRRRGEALRYWDMNFGKHPQEELFDLNKDRECLNNLAMDKEHHRRIKNMKEKLFAQLREQKDPRVLGSGDVFDQYPFFQQSSFFFYERYKNGEIKEYQTDWVNPSDYEIKAIE